MDIKDTKILELITKENELNAQLALYETMNKEYISVSKLDTPEKIQKFNYLNESMMNVKEKISALGIEIQNLDVSLSDYDKKLYGFKNDNNNRIKSLIDEIDKNSKELNKIKQTVDDYEGARNEISKIYVSDNIKYLFWTIITIMLIYNIFIGISLPYMTNLEKFIVMLLIIIVIYYLHIYIKNKVKTKIFN